MFGFIKKHPIISAAIGGVVLYTLGEARGMYKNESYHAEEINQNGYTTFYGLKNDKDVTTILKPVVEAATEDVAE